MMPSEDTQFKEGRSGNPMGRPKGSKNKITLQKLMLEEQLRNQSEGRMAEVLDKAFELALSGDRTMLKLLLELHMSKGVADMEKATEKVSIQISTTGEVNKKEAKPTAAEVAEEVLNASTGTGADRSSP